MGSNGSKAAYCGSSSDSSESGSGRARKRKSKGSRVFQSSCLGSRRHDDDIDDDIDGDPRSSSGVVSRKRTQQTTNLSATTSLINRSPKQCREGSSASSHLHSTSSDNQITLPIHNSARDSTTIVGFQGNSCSPTMFDDADNIETRLPDQRTGAREPVDSNVLFSRTLSVGRLRDRVLRRSSMSDLTFCPLEQGRDSSQVSGRRALDGDMMVSEPEGTALTSPSSSAYSSSAMPGIQDHELETSRSREAGYRDLLEHRSNFLARRRRIQSQVRALQRLGSRFENLSGHERSCILSGQHRTGRCTCRASNRDPNLNDDSSARASISRIVMLAEALFEVLDEIHQQSVVLSSRPSVSSLGSVPAPFEVVESLPVKSYTKSQKHLTEEAAQCYICLVEYEEGDSMRILPCHHDFHRTCIDKWLKEIHRVCPLCRGDICRAGSLPNEN